jgi:tetratricopeptide (TPR) repeat protein
VKEADVLDQQTLELDKRTREELLDSAKEFYRRRLYAKAVRLLREVVRRPDSPGEAHYLLGAVLVKRRRFLEAIPHLRSAMKRGFDRPEAHVCLGKAYLGQSERGTELEEALKELGQAITMARTGSISNESLADAHITAGRAEAARNNHDAALAHFESALRGAPEATAVNDAAHQEFFKLLAGRADFDQVVARLRAIIHRSRQPATYSFLATLLARLAKPDAAFEEYLWSVARYAQLRNAQRSDRPSLPSRWLFTRNSLSDSPARRDRLVRRLRCPLVEAAYGYGLIRFGAIQAGIFAQRRALEIAPTDADVSELVTRAIGQLGRDAGKPLLDAAVRAFEKSSSPAGHVCWARLLAEAARLLAEAYPEDAMAKLEQALDLAEQVGRIQPWLDEHADTILYILKLLKRIARGPAASANRLSVLVTRIEQRLPQTAKSSTLRKWGLALAVLDRPREALTRFQHALLASSYSSDPDESWVEEFKALSASFKTHPNLRIELSATVEQSRNSMAHAALVEVLMDEKLWSEAERFCLAWIKLAPDDTMPFQSLAKVRVEQRRFEAAITAYERAIERIPDSSIYVDYLNAVREMEKQSGAIGELVAAARKWNNGQEARINWPEVESARDQVKQKLMRVIQAFKDNVDDAYGPALFAEGIALQGMREQAAKLLEHLYLLFPGEFDTYDSWAEYLMSQGNYKAAIRRLRQVIRRNPSWFVPYKNRAACHMLLDRYEAGSRAYDLAFSNGTEFYGFDEVTAKIDAHADQATALSDAGLYEKALAKADQASQIKDDDYWVLFSKAYVLSDMAAYELAATYYARAINADLSIPHAHHNLGNLLQSQGLYQSARRKLDETLRVYNGGLEKRIEDRDSYLFSFHAGRCLDAKDDNRAEDLLRIGLLLDPENPHYEVELAKFYFGRKEIDTALPHGSAGSQEAVPEVGSWVRTDYGRPPGSAGSQEAAPPVKAPARLKALRHYRHAEAALKHRLGFARSLVTLLNLADLYMAAGEFDKARPVFEEAVNRQPSSFRAHTGLGECQIKLANPNEAIRSLGTSLRLAPHDLKAQLLAAQAFRRADKLDEAEEAYRRVLNVARCHVDALVGLSELYLDMAERRADKKDSTDLAELYSKAIAELTRAVNYFNSKDAPLIIASSKSSILYLLGYAQVKLYQTSSILRNRSLLDSAIKNFKACSESHFKASGEKHLKAQRALDTVLGEEGGVIRSWAERWGGTIVICLSMLLFLLAQVGMFWGRPVHREMLTFGPQGQAIAKSMGVPDDVLAKVKPLEREVFRNEESAVARLKVLVGPDGFAKFGGQLLVAAEHGPEEIHWESVDLGSYLLLTFGSVLLMIAGAYLPYLTSLKLAGVQLEKVSAERVETKATIAIERL